MVENQVRVPLFLKYAYAAIAGGCTLWFLLFGPNAAAQTGPRPIPAGSATSPVYLWAFTAIALTLAVAAVVMTMRKARS